MTKALVVLFSAFALAGCASFCDDVIVGQGVVYGARAAVCLPYTLLPKQTGGSEVAGGDGEESKAEVDKKYQSLINGGPKPTLNLGETT